MRSATGLAHRDALATRRQFTRADAAPRRQREFAFVARNSGSLVFIGTSTNPFARVEALRGERNGAIELVYIGLITGPVGEIRRHALQTLQDHDCGGRWHDVPPDQAVGALHRAAFKLDGGLREVQSDEAQSLLAISTVRQTATAAVARPVYEPPGMAEWASHPTVARLIGAFRPTKFKVTALAFIAIATFTAIGLSARY